jgi:hypothetical protein
LWDDASRGKQTVRKEKIRKKNPKIANPLDGAYESRDLNPSYHPVKVAG